MLRSRRTPLAWKNLIHDPRRLLIRLGGISFAVVLMFMEVGFLFALLDSSTKLIDDLNADIVLTSKAKYPLFTPHAIDRGHVIRAAACEGVRSATPVYMANSVIQHPGGKRQYIRVVAFDPKDGPFDLPVLAEHPNLISAPETALIDARSRKSILPDRLPGASTPSTGSELCGRRINLVGTFEMGRDFAINGTLVMSDGNFARYFPSRMGRPTLSLIDLGVIRLEDDADVKQTKQRLMAILPEEVRVHTKSEYYCRERWFWFTSTPVGFIFGLGCLLGLFVGVVICYQIIYTDISDHIPELATLKAMGYPKTYFVGLILTQALYLSLLSFLPGMLISWVFYLQLADSTKLLFVLSPSRAVAVFAVTVTMCIVSGSLAMRKLLAVDPAELF